MKILICGSILKKELKPLLGHFSKGDIKKYSKKAFLGLGVNIAGSKYPFTKLVKISMTSKSSAGRMIVLLYLKNEFVIPIVVRLKKDKILGVNLGTGNSVFQKLLENNLASVMNDLENGNFEELT